MTKYLPQDIQVLTEAASPYAANVSIDELPDGGWIVTWQDTFFPDYGVHLQRFDATGNRIGDEQNLGAMDQHDITVLSDGGWLLEGNDKTEFLYTPAVWRFDANGARVDLPDDTGTGFQTTVGLATGGWLGIRYAFTDHGFELSQQQFDQDGHATGPATFIATGTEGAAPHSDVVTLDDGGWLITWDQSYAEAATNVYQRRYAPDGSPIGDAEQVNTNAALAYLAPKSTTLSDGGWVTSYYSSEIVMQRYDAVGQKVGDPAVIPRPQGSSVGQWDIQGLDTGGWVLAWSQTDQVNPDYVTTLRVQVYDEDGDKAGHQQIIDDAGVPNIIALDDGAFVVNWERGQWQADSLVKQSIFRQAENADPVAVDDVAKMVEGTEKSIDVLKNDRDADAADFLTLETATVLSGNASVSIADDGELLVQDLNTQLVAGQKATVTIEYTMSDGFEIDTGLVTIEVNGTTDEGDQVLGTNKADRYKGFDFDDFYFGIGGNDVIGGRDGDDFLVGGSGKDNINAGDGNDTIVGGTGDDVLSGGWGIDIFVFERGDGRDVIRLRDGTQDIIDLTDFGFRTFNQVRRMTEASGFDLIIDLPGADRIRIVNGNYLGIDVAI